MNAIILKKLKNKLVLTIEDSGGTTARQITLIKNQEYVLNPVNNRYDKKRGRKVIFKSLEETSDGYKAKIIYLDTQRPGKVPIDYLDNVHSEIKTIKQPVQDMQYTCVYNELVPLFQLYLDILNVLDNKKDQANIAHISQKQMAELVNISPTNLSKRLRQLIRYGAIENVSPGVYKLINNSIWYTPYRTVHMVISLVTKRPELLKLYKEQAKVLDVSLDDITQAWAFINQISDH